MTGSDEYKNLKPKDFQNNMKKVNVIDVTRILDHKKFNDVSFGGIGLGE